jgi:uncharacterized protein YbaR (Trm112 family)
MASENTLTELLACPRCDKTPLTWNKSGYRCSACKTEFPDIGGIPWLFAEPDATLGEWRNRLHFSLQQLAHETKRLEGELKSGELREPTRRRLEHLRIATQEHRKTLQQVLSPIDIQTMQVTYESHLALRTRLPIDQGLNTYYANVHRDWAWGDSENGASLQHIMTALDASGGSGTGDTLVLGSGACRLAYDFHCETEASRTIALDFNPLLLLIAQRLIRGEELRLYEFPLAPKSISDAAILQKLKAPQPLDDNFSLVLADVLRPPFAAASFDTVVTPWLVDIVSEDLPVFAARVNQLLKPGGRWINFGSLAFDSPTRAQRYSPEEVMEIVAETGFATPGLEATTMPYMCSPASCHGRQETVFVFAGVKNKEAGKPVRHKALPDWIVVGDQPVPLLPSFETQTLSTQIYSFIMSLVDGKRSIADMAKLLEQQKLMNRKEAEPAIRNFLTRMYDDSQRNSGF